MKYEFIYFYIANGSLTSIKIFILLRRKLQYYLKSFWKLNVSIWNQKSCLFGNKMWTEKSCLYGNRRNVVVIVNKMDKWRQCLILPTICKDRLTKYLCLNIPFSTDCPLRISAIWLNIQNNCPSKKVTIMLESYATKILLHIID